MKKTIRQQTQLRSALVRTAERGLAKPADRLPRPCLKPRPLDFIIDGTACTDDTLTARFPRTTREAFGPYSCVGKLPKRITFIDYYQACPRGVALAAMLFVAAFLVGWGWK